ncbi:hypothetical protein CGG92_25465, partial [Vibrio parahaemolyticus]
EKQTAQIEYLLTHGLDQNVQTDTPKKPKQVSTLASKDTNATVFWSQLSHWQILGFGALLGGFVSLIIVAFIL